MSKTPKKQYDCGISNPRHFLLPSESEDDYRAYLGALYEDLKPVGHLERRQLTLVVREDLSIERLMRIIAELMHPRQARHNQPDRNPVYGLSARDQERADEKRKHADSLIGEAAMDDIIAATRWNYGHIVAQQKALSAAHARRSKLLGEFFALQERRRRGDAINLKVVGESHGET